MSSAKPKRSGRKFDYPEATKGSKTAARVRAETNTLSETEREELLQLGMQIIYGGDGKQKVGAGH